MSLAVFLAASPARQGQQGLFGGFDPSTTLGWSVPLNLLAPLVALVMMVSGMRSRRGAANLAELALFASGIGVGLAAWARWKQTAPFVAAYQWINIPVSFVGPQQFQGFGIDESIRLDHIALLFLASLLLLALFVATWHRVAGRAEPGPVRFFSLFLLLVFGASGVIVAPDLAELAGFWGFAAVATYLLLANRWGVEPASRGARVALWLPFVFDLCLLVGIAVLYSRYGQLTLTQLIPVLHTTAGAGPKALTLAGALLAVAIAGRLGLFPFSAWMTSAVEAPPAGHALVVGVWTLLPLYVLWRVEPVIWASGPRAAGRVAVALALLGLLGPVFSMLGNDIRRVVALAGSGAAAAAMLALSAWPATSGAMVPLLTVAAVPALAGTRSAGVLAAAAAASGLRSPDMALMGGGRQRLPRTSAALLLAALVTPLSLIAATAVFGQSPGTSLSGRAGLVFAAALVVTALALARPVVALAYGPLRRRRAFEPERVREAARPAGGTVLVLIGFAALLAGIGFLFTGWLAFLFGTAQAPVPVRTSVLWLGPVAGLLVGLGVFASAKDRLLAWSGSLGARWEALVALASDYFGRYLEAPALGAVAAVDGPRLAAGEGRLGLSLLGLGRDLRLLGLGAPALPLVILMAVVVMVLAAVGLVAAGLPR